MNFYPCAFLSTEAENGKCLTNYNPVLLTYTPENIRKTLGFLMFRGSIDKQH